MNALISNSKKRQNVSGLLGLSILEVGYSCVSNTRIIYVKSLMQTVYSTKWNMIDSLNIELCIYICIHKVNEMLTNICKRTRYE